MSCDDHALELIEFERAMVAKTEKRRKNIAKVLTTLPQGVSARKHQYTTEITTMWTE